jgi:hypothetical protein
MSLLISIRSGLHNTLNVSVFRSVCSQSADDGGSSAVHRARNDCERSESRTLITSSGHVPGNSRKRFEDKYTDPGIPQTNKFARMQACPQHHPLN